MIEKEIREREEEEKRRREEKAKIDEAFDAFMQERLDKERERKSREDQWWEDENAWRSSKGLPPLERQKSIPLPIPPAEFFAKIENVSGNVIRGVVSKIQRFNIPLRPYAPRKRSFMTTIEQMNWRLGRFHSNERVYRRSMGVFFYSFQGDPIQGIRDISEENSAFYLKDAPYEERRLYSSTKHLGERSVTMSAIGATFGKKTGKPFRQTSTQGNTSVQNLRRVPVSGILGVVGANNGTRFIVPMDYTFFPKMNLRAGSVEGRIFSVNDSLDREGGIPIPLARVHVKARMNSDGKTCTILSLVVALSHNRERILNIEETLLSRLEDAYRAGKFEESRRIILPPPLPRPRPRPRRRVLRKRPEIGIPFPRPVSILPKEGKLPSIETFKSLLEASQRLAQNMEYLSNLLEDETYKKYTEEIMEKVYIAMDILDSYNELYEENRMETIQKQWEDDWGDQIRELEGTYINLGNIIANKYESDLADQNVAILGDVPLRQVTFLTPPFGRPGHFFQQKAALVEELSRIAGYYKEGEFTDNIRDSLERRNIPIGPENAVSDWQPLPENWGFITLEDLGRVTVFYIRSEDMSIMAPNDLANPVTLGTDLSRYAFVQGNYYRIAPPFPEIAPPSSRKGKEPKIEGKEEEEWMLL